MICEQCKFENDCRLKKISPNLLGCSGPSEERAPKENEVRCWRCRRWVDKSKTFKDKEYKEMYTCFDCY